jgi:hypothetical protein
MNSEAYRQGVDFWRETAMLIVRGRLLGTVLALVIAALGAALVGRSPVSDEPASGCAAPAPAALAAVR